LLVLILVLILTLVGGLVRVVLGPSEPDRMLAAQLMGTTGVGVLLLLSEVVDRPSLIDVALVFSLLAAVTTVAFVRRSYLPRAKDASHHDVG
jgi:multicomponent Na+:H+ antiporter subunit F